ncbi:hypothetical protein ANOM_011476 [Aspergillus nomiae NRRL 13137]|uniref:Toxin biosynthesis ketoreductase n=1 Tax=Aspergillus nomiae NRRL (strain ATCC 15546 / NRRL 13137 / CBS 260.88 / M93) TaxID=1509407 RepID=A0A0L1ILK1_ASPN3|nr:uncharacterized protein ANOM_011476 [Aspergillus nomiae NRRL 13137]KNG80073.1 hypothetical protein ANOM_011476 [Aspergillus nomiae NRRL 13137]
MDQKVYLITGANRGIGLGFVQFYLSGQDNVVIACVRPSQIRAVSLQSIPTGPGSRLIVIPMESDSISSIVQGVQLIKENGISRIDVAISNAGISQATCPMASVPLSDIQQHIEVNAYGPLFLFREALDLLKNSVAPKFVYISTFAASTSSVQLMPDVPIGTYGASKALANYFMRRLSLENKTICTFSLAPGYVATESALEQAKDFIPHQEKLQAFPLISTADSVSRMARLIEKATTKNTNGCFLNYTGEDIPW